MPTWGAAIFGVVVSAILAAAIVWFALRERRPAVVITAALAAGLGPLLWDLVLRHTGGDFFTDAPGHVFPVSFEDAGSGVFATAIGAVLLGLGPLAEDRGRHVALVAMSCGAAALLVDVYLY